MLYAKKFLMNWASFCPCRRPPPCCRCCWCACWPAWSWRCPASFWSVSSPRPGPDFQNGHCPHSFCHCCCHCYFCRPENIIMIYLKNRKLKKIIIRHLSTSFHVIQHLQWTHNQTWDSDVNVVGGLRKILKNRWIWPKNLGCNWEAYPEWFWMIRL